MSDLNIRPEFINIQEENRGSKFLNVGFGEESLDQKQKSKGNKSKKKQVEHQGEIFCTTKETIQNLKGDLPSEKKYLQFPCMGLIPKIQKTHVQIKPKTYIKTGKVCE